MKKIKKRLYNIIKVAMEETLGKNTVIQFHYSGEIREIYYIPQDFKELMQEAKGKQDLGRHRSGVD